MRRVIALLMENQAGALARVVGLFSQRGQNIETLNVAPTEDPTLSRLTLTVYGDDRAFNSLCRHLNRLVDVFKVDDLSNTEYLGRELAVVKLRLPEGEGRESLREQISQVRGQLFDVDAEICVAEFTGNQEELASYIGMLSEYTLIEIARSGAVGISADAKVLAKLKSQG